jgi:hypothetical protein
MIYLDWLSKVTLRIVSASGLAGICILFASLTVPALFAP